MPKRGIESACPRLTFLPPSHLGYNYLVSVGLAQPQVSHLPLGEGWLGDGSGSCLEQRASTPSPALGVASKQTREVTRCVCSAVPDPGRVTATSRRPAGREPRLGAVQSWAHTDALRAHTDALCGAGTRAELSTESFAAMWLF